MTTWAPRRGVFLHRPRFGGTLRPEPAPQEPPFPWIVLPLLGLGFLVFFAALALMGYVWHAWELGLLGLGVALVAAGIGLAARFFHATL